MYRLLPRSSLIGRRICFPNNGIVPQSSPTTSRGILAASLAPTTTHHPSHRQKRGMSFSFAGPKSLTDILKKELVEEKTAEEVTDIWHQYHSEKENVHGLVLRGKDATQILLSRANSTPFFVQPIFREEGYFMLLSQFQEPCHFLLAYLEDYKLDPAKAQPLVTFSVFDDYAATKDIALVRVDVLNKGIDAAEGLKVVQSLLDGYSKEDIYKTTIYPFNKQPESFDLDDFIAQQNEKWKATTTTTTSETSADGKEKQ